jgi:hypothetical protein
MKRLVVLYAAAFVLTACVGSPLRVAQTTEQKAYALYGTFVIAEEQAAKLTAPTSTLAPAAKAAIIAASQRAAPAMDVVISGIGQYEAARADFEAAKIDKPAFQVVVDKLGGWVAQAQALVAGLLVSLKGAH